MSGIIANSNTSIADSISGLVTDQLPEYIRMNNPNFTLFLESYYEYLEQYNVAWNTANTISQGKGQQRLKSLLTYADVDNTIDGFKQHLYNEILKFFPQNIAANPTLVAKNAKQFYRSKGSPNSFRFLFHAIYGTNVEIYIPKNNILKTSSGKWFVQTSLRISNLTINGVANNTLNGLQTFVNTQVIGQTSNARAIVERVLISIQSGVSVSQLFVSDLQGDFENGETITTTDINGDVISAMLISGLVTEVLINNSGTLYNVGDPLLFSSPPSPGNVAKGYVSAVSQGQINTLLITKEGAGFKVNDQISFVGGGTTQNSNAYISTLDGVANNYWHPNTYNINSDIISNFLNVVINANSYGFFTPNVNLLSQIANSWNTFSYGPCGPAQTITILVSANNYITTPTADIVSNTRVKILGIIGRIVVVTGGINYNVGEQLVFTNVPGGYGSGANGIVANTAANGMILRCQLTANTGFLPGGAGYDINFMPNVSITTANGSGAQLVAASLLAVGYPSSNVIIGTSNLGQILATVITDPGSLYPTAPLINMTTHGDGKANLQAEIVTGVYMYPGRFLDETGFLSSAANFLEDQDYYQNYSYVLKVQQSIDQYANVVKNLVHPVGYKMWGEYKLEEIVYPLTIQTPPENNTRIETIYTANAIESLTTGSYLVKNTALTNVTNTVTGTLSMWLNIREPVPTSNGANSIIFYIGNNSPIVTSFLVKLSAKPVSNAANLFLEIVGKDINGNTILNIRTNTKDVITPSNNWIHLLSSWDLGNNNATIWLTNVNTTNLIVFTPNANVFLNTNAAGIIARANGTEEYVGDISELWFDTRFIDLTNVTNRNKFISVGLKPVSLGANGNIPTGVSPLIYLNGNVKTFNVNQGTGGNFNTVGSLTLSNTSPTDI